MSKIEAVLHREAAALHHVAELKAKEADVFWQQHGGTSEAADATLERLIAEADKAAQAADAHKAPRLDEDEEAIDAPCPGTCRNGGVAEKASRHAAKAHLLAAREIEGS